jgi:hypothetical protein
MFVCFYSVSVLPSAGIGLATGLINRSRSPSVFSLPSNDSSRPEHVTIFIISDFLVFVS